MIAFEDATASTLGAAKLGLEAFCKAHEKAQTDGSESMRADLFRIAQYELMRAYYLVGETGAADKIMGGLNPADAPATQNGDDWRSKNGHDQEAGAYQPLSPHLPFLDGQRMSPYVEDYISANRAKILREAQLRWEVFVEFPAHEAMADSAQARMYDEGERALIRVYYLRGETMAADRMLKLYAVARPLPSPKQAETQQPKK